MNEKDVGIVDTLTIVILTFNRRANLACTLLSLEPVLDILGLRVLVLDNASTDDTSQLVTDYTVRYNSVSYVRNPMNLGIEGNITRGMTLPTSKYTWLLSDHMVVFPEVVRSLIPLLADADAVVGCCSIQEYGILSGILPSLERFSSLCLQDVCRLIFWTSNISALLIRRDHVAARTREVFRFSAYSYPNLAIWSQLSDNPENQVLLLPVCSRFQTTQDVPAARAASYHFFRSRYLGFGRAIHAMNLHMGSDVVVPGDVLSAVPLFRQSAWETISADLCGLLPENISARDIAEFAKIYGWRSWSYLVASLLMLMMPIGMRPLVRHFRGFVGNMFRRGLPSALREYRKKCLADRQIREHESHVTHQTC